MFISLIQLAHLFKKESVLTFHTKDIPCISGFQLLTPEQKEFSEHCVYLTNSLKNILNLQSNVPANLILVKKEMLTVTEQKQLEKSTYPIIFIQHNNFHFVSQKIYQYLETHFGAGLFAETLLEGLFFDYNIQKIIDQIYPAFQNPIAVFDANYDLLGASNDEIVKVDIGKKIFNQKGLQDDEINLLNHLNHIHQKVQKSPVPVMVHHPEIGYDQLIFSINPGKNIGHIVITALNRPITENDKRMLVLLAHGIDQKLKNDTFIRNNRGFQYEYFLKDLLDGKLAVLSDKNKQFQYIEHYFTSRLYCIVIETARSSSAVNISHIRNLFETILPDSTSIIYDGEIVFIPYAQPYEVLPVAISKKFQEICTNYDLYAGLSNSFDKITLLPDYYKQALRAIELGISHQKSADLFRYSDFYLEHIEHLFLQKESAEVFCHPKVQVLEAYDQGHHTNLTDTLYQYLLHERNPNLTAECMGLHRNTITYRIRKIDDIVHINYDDPNERQYILLSYHLGRT